MDDEIYSPDELLAFHRVGEFLGWFARLEAVIDHSIIELLELEPTAGQLLIVYVNFSAKCSFLKELVLADGVGLSEIERKDAKGAIGKIQELAETRNTIAHSMFWPNEEGIKFSHGKKKLLSDRSRTIDQGAFLRYREVIAKSSSNVASITAQVRSKGRQKRIAELLLLARRANSVLN